MLPLNLISNAAASISGLIILPNPANTPKEARNNEYCNWDLLRDAINSFVQLGLQSANIIKQEDDYIWQGDRNLDLYNQHIEKAIIQGAQDEYA